MVKTVENLDVNQTSVSIVNFIFVIFHIWAFFFIKQS